MITLFHVSVPPTSDIWKHFVKGDITSRCKLCEVEVKTCGNTTNLNFHIQRNHPEVKILNLEKPKKTKQKMDCRSEQNNNNYDQMSPSGSSDSFNLSTAKVNLEKIRTVSNKQMKLDVAFTNQKSFQGNFTI